MNLDIVAIKNIKLLANFDYNIYNYYDGSKNNCL